MSETVNPIDGTRISFDVRGEGPTILLVHGSALSRSIWRGFGYVAALQDRYRVVAIDLRGHGRSAKPHDTHRYRMPVVLADIVAVLDAIDSPAAHFFGYSFGARAGFSLADSHPERMLSLISAGGTYRAPGGSVSELFVPAYDAALGAGGMPGFLAGWAAHSGAPVDPQTSAAFLANDPLALRAYFRQVEIEPGITDARLSHSKLRPCCSPERAITPAISTRSGRRRSCRTPASDRCRGAPTATRCGPPPRCSPRCSRSYTRSTPDARYGSVPMTTVE